MPHDVVVNYDAASAGDVQALSARDTMYHRAVNEVVRSTGLSPRLADVIVFRILKAWEKPTERLRTCPRGCAEVFSDEMGVCRGTSIDFGMSWSQQIALILQEGAQNGS